MARKSVSYKGRSVSPMPPAAWIVTVRDHRVMLDRDVAQLFGVETRALNQSVNRNRDKFGDDFAFRITKEELADLRSQNVISSGEWGGTRHRPLVFTEHGVVMAATLLRSPRAICASRFIVQTFVAARRTGEMSPRTRTRSAPSPLPIEPRSRIMGKVSVAIGHVLDAMVNPDAVKKAREEANGVLAESVSSLKELLKKPSLENEAKVAEIRKLMAEAESIEVETDGKRIRNEEQQMRLLAKKLGLVLQAQHFAETGEIADFLKLVNDLGRPPLLADER